MSNALVTCSRCAGCGRVADSADGEPWSAWASLGAARAGLVRPVLCPACEGTGRVADTGLTRKLLRGIIENVIDDMMGDLLYYDRKADDVLPVNAIERSIADGAITVEEIVERVRGTLLRAVDARRAEQQAPPPGQGEPQESDDD